MMVLVRIYPNRKTIGQSLSRVSYYSAAHRVPQLEAVERVSQRSSDNVYAPETDAPMAFSLSAVTELFVSTVEHEDYFMGTKTQITANSGKVEHFLFGRNEPALHHFHNNYRSALGMPPLEKYRAANESVAIFHVSLWDLRIPPHPNPLPRGEREEEARDDSTGLGLFPLPSRERARVRGNIP